MKEPDTYISVNKNNIRHNVKYSTDLPMYRVQTGSKVLYAWGIYIVGPSRLPLAGNTLSCGARAYVVTSGPVILYNAGGELFGGIAYSDLTINTK